MYIHEGYVIPIEVKSTKTKGFVKKILDRDDVVMGYSYDIDWKYLTSSSHRRHKMEVRCDGCEKIFSRRICDLNPEVNYHLCNSCAKAGDKNPAFGRPAHCNTISALKKYREENINAFSLDVVKEKIREKNPWEKVAKLNRGKKRSTHTKKLMSRSIKLAYKEGRLMPSMRWGKSKMGYYRGIAYQSSYELKFLKYCEEKDIFDQISRGPKVQYFDEYNHSHTYFIDYMLKNTNVTFEIKSSYIYGKNKKINEAKMKAASVLYEYHLILDNDFSKLDNIIHNDKRICMWEF